MKNFISILFMVFLLACKKEPQSFADNLTPRVEKGTLVFDSEDHLKDYYNHLQTIRNEGNSRGVRYDSLLLVELSKFIGFKPLLDTTITISERTNNVSSWLLDDVRKAILNEYSEVQIGDSIYVLLSENV